MQTGFVVQGSELVQFCFLDPRTIQFPQRMIVPQDMVQRSGAGGYTQAMMVSGSSYKLILRYLNCAPASAFAGLGQTVPDF